MTPEHWQQINQIFDEALEQPAAERAAFLTRACAGDEELRRRVEAMLAADARAELLLDHPAHEAAAGLFPDQSGETAAAHESEILSGHTIGSYHLLREIGRGGMGKVYLARDERLDRRVALKLLPARLTGDAARVARFQREARAASALNHPNILTIYDFGQDADRHYIAAEFVEGQTLRAFIGQVGCTLPQALDVAIQMAGALEAAHAAGIIHRDIKPENVMLRTDGFVKVLDFGLAKLTEVKAQDWDILRTSEGESEGRDDSRRLPNALAQTWATRPGMVMGTVAYMSPEQARGLEVDARSDLFSLGIVLYEMLTGERPFAGETQTDVLAALIEREAPPLSDYVADLPAELQHIISRVLAKPVTERYRTAREMGDDLKRLQAELAFAAKLKQSATRSVAPVRPNAGISAASEQPTRTIAAAAHPATRRTTLLNQLQRCGQAAARVWATARQWLWMPRLDSVAVLPFANVGRAPQMDYLPDGITESLINSLAQLPQLRVMARSTVFTYKGREVDPRQVGAALGVRTVVLGRVERRGERLLVGVELVNAHDGARLWGEQYERPLTDIFAVQEEVAREIARQLRLKLSRVAEQQLAKRYTADVEVYQLYLKGRHHFLQFNRVSQEQALAYFQQVVALAPRYALAYTGIADVYADCSSQYLAPSEAMPRAKQAVLQALAIDDQLAEAHHSLAVIKWFGDWDWAGAEAEFRRALALNPNAATTCGFYSDFLLRLKRFEEALAQAQRCYDLDPLSTHGSIMVSKGLFYLRRYEQSIAQCRQTLVLDPHYFWAHVYLAHNFTQQGRRAEAIAELRRALEINRHDGPLAHLGCLYAAMGHTVEARQTLAELEEQARRRHVSPVHRAQVHVGLGEPERALELLRQAYEERADHLLSLNINPAFDGLRADPRFLELLQRVGLMR